MFVDGQKTREELEAAALIAYIDNLTYRLDHKIFDDSEDYLNQPRPASPVPEYDRNGCRTNTREQRKMQELEVERTIAVIEALHIIPHYLPPPSMTKLAKITEKVFLPVREYPHINFIGLLLGPRGNNLRHMESESGAKIGIRGRGSVKEGSRSSSSGSSSEDLHCVVTAVSPSSIKRAKVLIEEVVSTAVQTPEHKNDFKRLQLRELAMLNGTLRDYESELCGFCRQPGHRKYDCASRQELMRQSECRKCQQKGHFEKNCGKSENGLQAAQSFLAEIGNDNSDTIEAADPVSPFSTEPSSTPSTNLLDPITKPPVKPVLAPPTRPTLFPPANVGLLPPPKPMLQSHIASKLEPPRSDIQPPPRPVLQPPPKPVLAPPKSTN